MLCYREIVTQWIEAAPDSTPVLGRLVFDDAALLQLAERVPDRSEGRARSAARGAAAPGS
jgi:hypothetical protein